jgi:hypothetical protein
MGLTYHSFDYPSLLDYEGESQYEYVIELCLFFGKLVFAPNSQQYQLTMHNFNRMLASTGLVL